MIENQIFNINNIEPVIQLELLQEKGYDVYKVQGICSSPMSLISSLQERNGSLQRTLTLFTEDSYSGIINAFNQNAVQIPIYLSHDRDLMVGKIIKLSLTTEKQLMFEAEVKESLLEEYQKQYAKNPNKLEKINKILPLLKHAKYKTNNTDNLLGMSMGFNFKTEASVSKRTLVDDGFIYKGNKITDKDIKGFDYNALDDVKIDIVSQVKIFEISLTPTPADKTVTTRIFEDVNVNNSVETNIKETEKEKQHYKYSDVVKNVYQYFTENGLTITKTAFNKKLKETTKFLMTNKQNKELNAETNNNTSNTTTIHESVNKNLDTRNLDGVDGLNQRLANIEGLIGRVLYAFETFQEAQKTKEDMEKIKQEEETKENTQEVELENKINNQEIESKTTLKDEIKLEETPKINTEKLTRLLEEKFKLSNEKK